MEIFRQEKLQSPLKIFGFGAARTSGTRGDLAEAGASVIPAPPQPPQLTWSFLCGGRAARDKAEVGSTYLVASFEQHIQARQKNYHTTSDITTFKPFVRFLFNNNRLALRQSQSLDSGDVGHDGGSVL